MRTLSEHEEKNICECENCGNYPLKHLERCDKCNSTAWHTLKIKYEVEDNEQ